MLETQNKLTTVQISVSAREMLRFLSGRDRRSMAKQLEWMIDQAFLAEQTDQADAAVPVISIQDNAESGA